MASRPPIAPVTVNVDVGAEFELTYGRAVAANADIVPPVEQPWGMREFVLRLSAGHQLVVTGPPDGEASGHRVGCRALHDDVAGAGRACTTSVWSPSAGPSDGVSKLRTSPDPVRRSGWAAVPSATPTASSPLLVCTDTPPLTAVATATSPEAVCALTLPCSRLTVSEPLAARNFTSPSRSPIAASPEAVDTDRTR